MSGPLDWIIEDLEAGPVDLCRLAVGIGEIAGLVTAVARWESAGVGEDPRPELAAEIRTITRRLAGIVRGVGIDPLTAIRGAMARLDQGFCAAADNDQWVGAVLFEFGRLAHAMASTDDRADACTQLSRLAAITAMWTTVTEIRINENNEEN